MFEVFLVSAVYWSSLLVLFVWLHRRLQELTGRIELLEKDTEGKEE